MSIQKLPTELDSKIAYSLIGDTESLSAFSKTSKYYRRIAEPFLYSNIEVDRYNDVTSLRLLFTLLDRKELGLYIHNLTRTSGNLHHEPELGKKRKLQSDSWKYVKAIRDKIDKVIFSNSDLPDISSLRLNWFGEIMASLASQIRATDQILALLLIMAPKIQHLEVHNETLFPTSSIILRVLRSTSKDGGSVFKNLQHFTMHGAGFRNHTIPIWPTLKTLEILCEEVGIPSEGTIFDYPFPMPLQPALRRIEFNGGTFINPTKIQRIVRNLAISNLRELVVNNCGNRGRVTFHKNNNLVELLRALEKHTPLLELIEWSNQKSTRYEEHPLFDTFKGFEHLRKLHIDYDLLIPRDDTNLTCLHNPGALFPAHLEDLTLDSFDMDLLHKLVSALERTMENAEDESETEALRAKLASLSAMFPLKHLSLIVPMESRDPYSYSLLLHEFPTVDVKFFKYAANELHRLGVTFEVWRKEGACEKEKKLLVKKGWTAPLPHSV